MKGCLLKIAGPNPDPCHEKTTPFRLGPVTIVLAAIPLFYWIWIAAKHPFLSMWDGTLLNFLASGAILSEAFNLYHAGTALDRTTIGRQLFHFTLMTVTAVPYLLLMRRYSERQSWGGYLTFSCATSLICLLLFSLVIWPLLWLVQYMVTYGVTARRIIGLAYSILGLASLVFFWAWCIMPTNHVNNRHKNRAQESAASSRRLETIVKTM